MARPRRQLAPRHRALTFQPPPNRRGFSCLPVVVPGGADARGTHATGLALPAQGAAMRPERVSAGAARPGRHLRGHRRPRLFRTANLATLAGEATRNTTIGGLINRFARLGISGLNAPFQASAKVSARSYVNADLLQQVCYGPCWRKG